MRIKNNGNGRGQVRQRFSQMGVKGKRVHCTCGESYPVKTVTKVVRNGRKFNCDRCQSSIPRPSTLKRIK